MLILPELQKIQEQSCVLQKYETNSTTKLKKFNKDQTHQNQKYLKKIEK